jgi:hypothetical protein
LYYLLRSLCPVVYPHMCARFDLPRYMCIASKVPSSSSSSSSSSFADILLYLRHVRRNPELLSNLHGLRTIEILPKCTSQYKLNELICAPFSRSLGILTSLRNWSASTCTHHMFTSFPSEWTPPAVARLASNLARRMSIEVRHDLRNLSPRQKLLRGKMRPVRLGRWPLTTLTFHSRF